MDEQTSLFGILYIIASRQDEEATARYAIFPYGSRKRRRFLHLYNTRNTFSSSMLTSYIVRRTLACRGVSPVFGSNCQPCHGQMSLLSSILPWPRGPPQCGHTLSVTQIVPFTFAMHTVLPFATNSCALPDAGRFDLTVTLTRIPLDCVSKRPSI